MVILTEILGLDCIKHITFRSYNEAAIAAKRDIFAITEDYFEPTIKKDIEGRTHFIVNNNKADPSNFIEFIIGKNNR